MFLAATQKVTEQVIYVEQTHFVPMPIESAIFLSDSHQFVFLEQLKPFETTEHEHFSQMVHVFGLNCDLNAKIEVLFTDTEGAFKTGCVLSSLLKFTGVSESAALRQAKL